MSCWLGMGAAVLAAGMAVPVGLRAADEPEKETDFRIIRPGGGARLGVQLTEVDAETAARLALSEERGAVIKSVDANSPAAKAGLKADDVVVGYQGERVHSAAQLARLVRETPPGRKVAIDVSRAGAVQKLTATLEEQKGIRFGGRDMDFDFDLPVPPVPAIDILPPRAPRPPRPPHPPEEGWSGLLEGMFGGRGRLGIRYQELSDQLAGYFKVAHGLLVTHVEEGSPAATAGLLAGDVILKVDGRDVKDGGDLRDAVSDASEGAELSLSIQRDGRPATMKVKLRDAERRTRGRGMRT